MIRRLCKDCDWTLGQGLKNYANGDEEVVQNLVTRLKSFKNNWFLDVEANIDWLKLLSIKNNEKLIVGEIIRVVGSSEGVLKINSVKIIENNKRSAIIAISFVTIYGTNIDTEVEIGT